MEKELKSKSDQDVERPHWVDVLMKLCEECNIDLNKPHAATKTN